MNRGHEHIRPVGPDYWSNEHVGRHKANHRIGPILTAPAPGTPHAGPTRGQTGPRARVPRRPPRRSGGKPAQEPIELEEEEGERGIRRDGGSPAVGDPAGAEGEGAEGTERVWATAREGPCLATLGN